ncbi:RHS repeat-associated core domain-containing protein [Sorangium sp. So ce260]|uniref:RHS repeat-associated core domain-containing protein n=1 Tax=Sorangium sp. So ce260 TaxID=3133291 RepID=UPI003F5D787C
MIRRRRTMAALTGLAFTVGTGAAAAAPFKDQLVQPPSIGQPERGSIAGSLSRLAFGPSSLARGVHSVPLPIDAPSERGSLLASVIPSYSPEGGVSEWGVGWQTDLAIRRHRVGGEIDFTMNDDFTSPWGRLSAGDDGAYYPAGLRNMVRLVATGGGWQATTSDGTRYFFDAADADTTPDGTYAWNLSRVDTLFGDSTTLTWVHNATGRAFLSAVHWGGRFDGTQYRMTFTYQSLATPFATFVSGQRTLLDRRVARVTTEVSTGAGYAARWRHDLAYETSPTGPAFYVKSVTKTYASGASEPPVTYRYDISTEQLTTATFQDAPELAQYLSQYGSGAIQPERASMTDLERDGLTDLEINFDNTLVRQTEDGYVFEPLSPPIGGENPLCRPAASATNKPRSLARMHGEADEPNVVVTQPSGTGSQTRIIVCDRRGFTQFDQWHAGGWALGANTRLADLDRDHRPDFVRVSAGVVQVLRNTSSSPTDIAFTPGPTSTLQPMVSPTSSWVQDLNGDGRPDLMVRHANGVQVWRGIGAGRFEQQGTAHPFTTTSGLPLANLSTYEFSHGDFNNDGLSDLILTKGQSVFLFTNRGGSFVQAPVSAFASIPWTVSYPMIADLSGSGNEQVVMADGTNAKVLQLSRPSTGLLVAADDGKGTVIRFDYGRVRPAPGVNHLYSVLASMTVESSGYDPVTFTYEYGAPVWHTEGRYLVGFEEARKQSPFLQETVAFHNDDDIAGVVTGTVDLDDRAPGLERFSERTLEAATFHGVPWLRLLSEEGGWREAGGSATVTTRTDYLEYDERGVCPLVVQTSGPSGIHRLETTLATVAELDPELVCLTESQRLLGIHGDPTLDYDYRIDIDRDDLGRLTRATQLGPSGEQILQEVVYSADHRVSSVSAPGAGTSRFTYDASTGQLASTTSPDGVVQTVVARDPTTDALTQSSLSRDGATWNNFSAYDGLERLRATWDDLSGADAANPLTVIDYVWATANAPGQILERRLIDAATNTAVEVADIMAADGAVLAKAVYQPGGWSLSRLTKVDRNALESRVSARDPLPTLTGLTNASLFAGATLLGASTTNGAGDAYSSWSTVQSGVVGNTEVSRAIVGDEIVVTTVENGAYVTKTASGADGRPRRFQDQNGVVTTYVYDALGRLRRVQTPSGAHTLDFDGYGRPSHVSRENVQRIEWSYSPVTGQMTERRELSPAGDLDRTAAYEYDAIGRKVRSVETRASTAEVRTLETHWDGAVPGGATLPGQRGFATTTTTEEVTKVVAHDAKGRATGLHWNLDGWRTLDQAVELYANGETKSVSLHIEDGDGATILDTIKEYEYDAHGRLARCLVDGVELFSMTYDANGRVHAVQLAGGDLTLQYDPTTRARRGYQMTGDVAGSFGWGKDARGLTATETFALDGASLTRSYGYDARGYLVSSSDAAETAGYAYDASGLISAASDASGDRPIARTLSSITAGSESYSVDAMGRVVAHDDLVVEYGPSGHIEHAWRGQDAFGFAYDEAGQRVLKYKNGTPVAAYVAGAYLDEDGLIEPVNVAGVMVGVLENGVFNRLPFDARGTLFAGETGELSLASPYGARLTYGPHAEAIDYVTKGYDKDLGLVRMGVRDYDPLLGQFWTPDPLFLSSIEKCAASPAECNLYGYAGNNPVTFMDPTGTEKNYRREPPVQNYEYKDMVKLREQTGLAYGESHSVFTGDRVVTPIDYAITLESLKDNFFLHNSHNMGSTYYLGPIPVWYSPNNVNIPQRDLQEIGDILRTLPTGAEQPQYITSGGYEVRIWVVAPIAGQLTDGSMSTGWSSKTSQGLTFREYKETSSDMKLSMEAPIGAGKVGAEGSYGTKSGHEKTSQVATEVGRSAQVQYGVKFEAEKGIMMVGVWKSGFQPAWAVIEGSTDRDAFHVIQHVKPPL